MTSKRVSNSIQIPLEPRPVSVDDDLESIPNSPESQSFVVIKSAADLESFDDNEIADFSMALENKNIIQEELAFFDMYSNHPQSSAATIPSCCSNATTFIDGKVIESNAANGTNVEELFRSQGGSVSKPFANGINNEPSTLSSSHIFSSLLQPPDNNEHATVSIADFSPGDFCSEGIQTKVYQLVEENVHLKDTLIQNNKSMKAQYDKVVAWQKNTERAYEVNKQAFHERNRIIATLKDEVAALKQENNLLRDSLNAPKCDTDINNKELELLVANKNIKKLEETLQGLTLQSQQEINDSSQKIKHLEASVKELIQKNNKVADIYGSKIRELEEAQQKKTEKSNEDLSYEKEKMSAMEMKLSRYESELESAYKKISNLEKQKNDVEEVKKVIEEKLLISEMANERAKSEIVLLRSQIEHMKTLDVSEESSKLQTDFDKLLAEKEKLITELDTKKSQSLDDQAAIQILQEKLEQTLLIVKESEAKVAYVKEKEEQAKVEAWKSKRKLDELEQKYELIQKNPDTSRSAGNDEIMFIRQQLMQSQMALTECNQKRAIAEAHATLLKSQNEELQTQLGTDQEHNNDDLFALKTQLELYKSDFDAEREAKEEVKRKSEKTSEDLQQLHRRNQQLQEEIEHLREQLTQLGSMPGYRPSRNEPSSSKMPFVCPKCSFRFNSLNQAELHVLRCIDIDDSLP